MASKDKPAAAPAQPEPAPLDIAGALAALSFAVHRIGRPLVDLEPYLARAGEIEGYLKRADEKRAAIDRELVGLEAARQQAREAAARVEAELSEARTAAAAELATLKADAEQARADHKLLLAEQARELRAAYDDTGATLEAQVRGLRDEVAELTRTRDSLQNAVDALRAIAAR